MNSARAAATLLRVSATLTFRLGRTMLALAALLGAALMLIWRIRHAS
jgi:hypothetical protein